MSTTLRVLTLILAAISMAPVHGQPEAPRVVMISVDGLMPVSYIQGSETVTPSTSVVGPCAMNGTSTANRTNGTSTTIRLAR